MKQSASFDTSSALDLMAQVNAFLQGKNNIAILTTSYFVYILDGAARYTCLIVYSEATQL